MSDTVFAPMQYGLAKTWNAEIAYVALVWDSGEIRGWSLPFHVTICSTTL